MQIKVETEENKRLDRVVTDILTSEGLPFTRNIVQENITELSKVNSNQEKKSYKLKKGDVLELDIDGWRRLQETLDLSEEIISQKGDLDIRYEDSDLLVIYKPKGITVHPGVGNWDNTLANYLRYYLESKNEYDGMLDRVGIVHRLDKGVSGLMVVAKKKSVQEFLKQQFKEKSVVKVYRAKVEKMGSTKDPQFIKELKERDIEKELQKFNIEKRSWLEWYPVEGYIGRSTRDRYKMEFKKYQWGSAKYAKSYILPSTNEVLVKIETGRMHQIRATLEYLGLHILGDTLYGVSKRVYTSSNIELESVILSFVRPNKERLTVKAYES